MTNNTNYKTNETNGSQPTGYMPQNETVEDDRFEAEEAREAETESREFENTDAEDLDVTAIDMTDLDVTDLDQAGDSKNESNGGNASEADTAECSESTASKEQLKIIISVRQQGGTIGIAAPHTDPYIENFPNAASWQLGGYVPAVIDRARARWAEQPKNPEYERPAPPPRKKNQKAVAKTENSGPEVTEQQTLSLF